MYQSRLLSFLLGAALCIVACSGADSGPETETESSESGSTVTETSSGTLPRIDTGSLSPKSPKLGTGEYNPLVDSRFMADPTAVEYDGRLYVYATDDHRQYELSGENTYEKIRSLSVISTDDMVNWTFHGTIPVGEIAPWIIASWAPSVVCTRQADGSSLFSLYFSNSGWGVGVLQAPSPLGPWTSPLGYSLIDGNNETVRGSGQIFDPGAAIDDDGGAWLAFGGTQGWLARLNPDMHSFAAAPQKLPSPFHFEANELNFIGGKCVYTYNTDWSDHSAWTWGGTAPGPCSMVYMKSTTPLDADSWTYGGMYFKNPGYNGLGYGNNHTHLHKYGGNWYLFYHTSVLQGALGEEGGFRSLAVDRIEVDESGAVISECIPGAKGVQALKALDPFISRSAATASATWNITFNPTEEDGHVTVAVGTPFKDVPDPDCGIIEVRNVDFGSAASRLVCRIRGKGLMSLRLDDWQGQDCALYRGSGDSWVVQTLECVSAVSGVHTLYFVLEKGVEMDAWRFFSDADA